MKFRSMRTIRDYKLGPEIKGSNTGPLNCIKTFLAMKENNFYRIKVLQIDNPGTKLSLEI